MELFKNRTYVSMKGVEIYRITDVVKRKVNVKHKIYNIK